MRRAAVFLFGVFTVALSLWAGTTQLMSRATRAQTTYSKDNGYFYRLTANFTVKETGEKLNFDYVVACNIRVTRWRDGGLSDDSTFSPRVMVKATSAGHAVLLKTLNECTGLTSEKGEVPPDILPMAVWFESVENLSNGLAYVSEDAYDSPLTKLTFGGARIDRATRADWEAWRKQASDEFVERGALPGPWGYDYSNDANVMKIASACQGYTRLKLPDVIRAKVRPLWPASQPRFWAPPNEDDTKISGLLRDSTVKSPPGVRPWIMRFGNPGDGNGSGWTGMPLRSGSKVQMAPHAPRRWPTENYPYLLPPLASAHPITAIVPAPPVEAYVQKIDFRDGALNGFAACQSRNDLFEYAISGADPAWKRKRHVFMVDDQIVRQPEKYIGHMLQPGFVFERDEYVFIRFIAGL